MKVIFRNFFRNTMVNVTAQSVKHFIPDAEFHCITFYKENADEYQHAEPLHDWIKEYKMKTKYVHKTDRPTDSDNIVTSGYANPDNVLFFTEWYNICYYMFRDVEEKILFLGEDHYFTTGQTLKELVENDFDVAYAEWDKPHVCWFEANASIMCFRPAKVAAGFPIPEIKTGEIIETIMGRHLLYNTPRDRIYRLTTRSGIDYRGDGSYTNSSTFIREELKRVGIL